MPTVEFDLRGAGKIPAEHEAIGAAAEASAKKQAKIGQSWRASADEAAKYDRLAKQIVRDNETAQERYNRKLGEAKRALAGNAREVEILAKQQTKLRVELLREQDANQRLATTRRQAAREQQQQAAAAKRALEEQRRAQENAFGKRAIAQIASFAASFFGVGAAISAVTRELTELASRREQVAAQVAAAKFGLGELAQLSATEGSTDAERRAAQAANVAEARGILAEGGAANLDEAGGILFRLKSAGLSRADRAFATRIRSRGALNNIGGAAEAFSALQTTLGGQQVGSFEDFLDQALQSSAIAPALANEIPQAAARAGGSARQLGIGLPFLLAATARLGKATGTANEGGTQLAAFLKQLEKSRANPAVLAQFPQLGQLQGDELLRAVFDLPDSATGFGGIFGDRAEAIQGFRTLQLNRRLLGGDVRGIHVANRDNLATAAARLPVGDAGLAASLVAQQIAGEETNALERGAQFQSLAGALQTQQRGDDQGALLNTLNLFDRGFNRLEAFLDPENFVRKELAVAGEKADPRIRAAVELIDRGPGTQTAEAQEAHQKRIVELLEDIKGSFADGGLTGVAQ